MGKYLTKLRMLIKKMLFPGCNHPNMGRVGYLFTRHDDINWASTWGTGLKTIAALGFKHI